MIDLGKKDILGVMVDAVDYEAAVQRVMHAAEKGAPYAVSALAVHGVMTGVQDPEHRYRLNHLDLVTPDGQPVRWAINLLHRSSLRERVYGPRLMLEVCRAAAVQGLPVYLYGSQDHVLEALMQSLRRELPNLVIAGASPSRFRSITESEKADVVASIVESGAKITFVGLGCPRQEVFVYEFTHRLNMPTLAVGAAFDYHAGLRREPPAWIQRAGLQWLHRFGQDPRRLWKRYVLLNPSYAYLVCRQWLHGESRPSPTQRPTRDVGYA